MRRVVVGVANLGRCGLAKRCENGNLLGIVGKNKTCA